MAKFLIFVLILNSLYSIHENTIWESIKLYAPVKHKLEKNVHSVQPFFNYKEDNLKSANVIASRNGLNDFNEYLKNNPNNSMSDYAGLKGIKNLSELYESYQQKFSRDYTSDESVLRQMQILVSLIDIKNNTDNKGITSLTDRTHKEYHNRLGAKMQSQEERKYKSFNVSLKETEGPLPLSFDWREKDVVWPVEDQGECMSCWAFSLTDAIQSHHAIKYGKNKLRRVSVQQLLDCAHAGGCRVGFWPKDAVKYLIDKLGGYIASRDSYPYLYPPKKYSCYSTLDIPIKVKGFVSLPKNSKDEELMRALIDNGPLTVVMRFDAFQNYRKGVIFNKEECKEEGTHAVTLIGWGSDSDGNKYWIIKNSFGPDWGEGGYIRVKRGENVCLLKKWVLYPVID